MVDFPTLYSNDLTMRCLKASDIRSLFEIYNDAETMYLFGNQPKNIDQVGFLIESKLNAFKSFTGLYFVLVKTATNEVVGFLDLNYYEYAWQVEFCINRFFRKKGYAKQALNEAINFCRKNQIREIHAKVKAANDISSDLLLKLNFHRNGLTTFYDTGESEIGFGYKLVL